MVLFCHSMHIYIYIYIYIHTYSVPALVQPGLLGVDEEAWDPVMLEAHTALCDVLLTRNLQGIQLVVQEALRCYPLYDEEVTTVMA